MTAPARITQDDMSRAAKAVRAAGYERARIVMDLEKAKIEIIIGEPEGDSQAEPPATTWSDDDV